MRWKSSTLGSTVKLLAPGLSILVLVVLFGGRFTSLPDQSNGPEPVAKVTNASEEMSASGIETKGTPSASDKDQTLAAGGSREAAAGPQSDDTPHPAEAVPQIQKPLSLIKRVGIQAGHWKSAELPDELSMLRNSTGTSGGGVAEWQLNLDIAKRVAALLEGNGLDVDVLPATIPPGYQADAFVALHADGDTSGRLSGFKLAKARWSALSHIDDALMNAISEEYRAVTKLGVDPNVTRNMTGYYAFNNRRYEHAIAPTTPGVILEMGFLTNASDRQILLRTPDVVAKGIAQGVLRFLRDR